MKACYQLGVRGLGLSPAVFWRMPPRHFGWLVETLEPPRKTGLDDDEIGELRDMLARAVAEHEARH